MIYPKRISISILTFAVSWLLTVPAQAQRKKTEVIPDSTALFQGVEVSTDLVGPAMRVIGDYGHFSGALRINLKDRYFPAFELGYASCDETDDGTHINYKTSAPFWKVGADFNIMRNKHDIYRVYIGARYAFTSYKADYSAPPVEDPIWGGTSEWGETDMKCKCSWAEILFGVQAKIWGPIDLGWSMRYCKRLSYSEGDYSNAWYVPGFGKTGNSNITATFDFIIVI